jgi:hypothetical protein
MGGSVSPSILGDMTGDFLPERRRASVLSQTLTVVLLLALAALVAWMFL